MPVLLRMRVAIGSPQPGDFQPVLNEFTAYLKMFGDLLGSVTLEYEFPERSKRNKRSRAGGVSSFFVCLPILSRGSPAAAGFGYYL